ncbi:Substrate-binding region of ABC-type glycine betaine transport system [Gloeothece citriformis PCC 7424]|uniref:Substrate-binding region of ABC-type glycine betaine transport system n=1 Tax=Gloeothece citriformis (strain PCC 7424) TaxID=65393 RepID=B7K7A3_GLOC7|nr:glycine betaine ABC transporter substrate-binding protein [Gloeothece citriformis]ACK69671.1 Substrate-binding region of ABC-type glycine betaine transport system [Gloeothece citriformis PCC 7424]
MNDLTEIWWRTAEHLLLVALAIGVAIAVGLPLGIVITRYPKLVKPVLGVANGIQTIPSLAIFGFLLSVPLLGGIGKIPAIVALILYALLPIIRNTYTGITSVDPAIREAAKGMGMNEKQILLQVEIPLALGIILAGVRISTVICVGIATIAAAIGGGGLGVFIFRGIATVNNQLILAGAIPAAVIALLADGGIGWLEKRLTPPYRQKLRVNKRRFLIGLGLLGLLLISLWAITHQRTSQVSSGGGTVIIGSKNFTEQVILGELLAQEIEAKTNLTVDRRLNLGGTFICHEAVKTGQIDGYVEYTGTSYTAILKKNPISDREKVYQQVKQFYGDQLNLEVFPSLGFENTYAIVIRREYAEKYQVKTLSEIAKYTPNWKAGFGHEFLSRKDGYPGLAKTYGLKFAQPPEAMELGLIYQAISQKQVDLVAGSSTDGLIPVLNLVILEDDKRYFPPYDAVPIFNKNTLEKYPQLEKVISELGGFISAEEMQQLNYQVDSQAREVEEVVKEFLKAKT